MRLLLPLLCGVIAASAVVLPSRAEGDRIVAQSVVTGSSAVQPVVLDRRIFKPMVAGVLPADPVKETVVLRATPAIPADELAPGLPPDRQKTASLRGSVLMLLIPNLCCR